MKMMKKILGCLFILMMVSGAAAAAELASDAGEFPDEERWLKVAENAKTEYWIDSTKITFTEEETGVHADVWETFVDKKAGTRELINCDINMTTQEFRHLSTVDYAADGRAKSRTVKATKYYGIVPGTAMEHVFKAVAEIYQLQHAAGEAA